MQRKIDNLTTDQLKELAVASFMDDRVEASIVLDAVLQALEHRMGSEAEYVAFCMELEAA